MRKTLLLTLAMFVLIVAADAQKVSVLYRFGTNTGDPLSPYLSGIIAQGRDGNLYTTAPYGGANNLGTVFKITPAGKLTALHSFDLDEEVPREARRWARMATSMAPMVLHSAPETCSR